MEALRFLSAPKNAVSIFRIISSFFHKTAIRSLSILMILMSGIKPVQAATIKTMLSEAIASGIVKITAQANGNIYNKKGLTLNIENNSRKTVELTIEPALLFRPEDTSYQDLVIAGNLTTTIEPRQSKTIALQSYCAKSYARSPVSGIAFRFQKQCDSNMIRTFDFIRKNDISNELAQHAVWVLANGHELRSVYQENEDAASRKLIAFMALLLKEHLPDYYKLYEVNAIPGQPVFKRKKALKIFTTFQWKLDTPQNLTMAVYDEKGAVVEKMFEQQLFRPGGYELSVKFESAKADAGDYYIRLKAGETVIREIKVSVD